MSNVAMDKSFTVWL